MTPVIRSGCVFLGTSPAKLYSIFTNSVKHTAATGMPAKVSAKPGGKWSAFGGMILGKYLLLVPNRMVVQTWRSSAWKKGDSDSILVVSFEKAPGGAQITLDHVGVPAHDHDGVTKGWVRYYWEPWKAYLEKGKHPA